jgi:methylated-DNA-protein-cysteine methyltransferase related protein
MPDFMMTAAHTGTMPRFWHNPGMVPAGPAYERIYAVVARIPRGKVASYGQVAALAGLPRHARQVGYAMSAIPEGRDLPWQRVVNSKGEVSRRALSFDEPRQRFLLEKEGVRFGKGGRIDLERYGWRGRR